MVRILDKICGFCWSTDGLSRWDLPSCSYHSVITSAAETNLTLPSATGLWHFASRLRCNQKLSTQTPRRFPKSLNWNECSHLPHIVEAYHTFPLHLLLAQSSHLGMTKRASCCSCTSEIYQNTIKNWVRLTSILTSTRTKLSSTYKICEIAFLHLAWLVCHPCSQNILERVLMRHLSKVSCSNLFWVIWK